ncbi:MAG: DNA polymerase III subunit alpha, partial [Gemmatimonadota bacterium]
MVRFALEAERRGVKPVVGAELVVDGHPAAFLARDGRGFRNLAALVTRARVGSLWGWGGGERPEGAGVEPGRGRPGVDFEAVAERSEGLIALTGPATGEIASLIRSGRPEEAMLVLDRWRSVFGADRLAVEVQRHNVSGEESALAGALIELAERGGVPWVVTNDPRYLDGGGRLVHDVLTALRAGVDMDAAARRGVLHPNGEWRLKSPRAMARLWRGGERGLEESVRIAEECDFDLRWLCAPLPTFPVPEGRDEDAYLRELVFAGARRRWGEVDERRRKQIEHELGVIRRLGFAGFFLVMWDAVRYAKRRGILCQGRGSAANSAVAYCLEITAVDPVEHGLLFERFLSEGRVGDGARSARHRAVGRSGHGGGGDAAGAGSVVEAPDIDVDFEMHRREEVLDYVYERYRRPHAAITCTTLTYHAPSALQDVMRALGYPAELARTLSTRLRRYHPVEGAELLRDGLAARHGLDVERDPRGRAILAALHAMEELPRLRATHPGGFVLSSEPLGEYLPIERTAMGRTILQFDKDDLDAAGVPKFDFLGLGGLSAIHRAFDAIEARTGERLELYRLPTDDRRTYEMIADGDTVGLFQIESRAQIQSILHTRPERLYDLVVQVALIRPGPIQADFVRPYTRRRRGLEPVRYRHPALEPILRRTYGIPIFQEQAMAISMELGGFTASEADALRRTMGHRRKLPKLHAALQWLKRRIVSRGVAGATAEAVVDDLYSFANYGFPESHAWSFALIAYAHAYLKAHWPAEFYLGLLNSWPMGFYPPATLVHDARRHGVTVRPPCLRHGEWDCTLEAPLASLASPGAGAGAGAGAVETGGAPALRLGLRFIEGLGEHTRDALRAAREDGPFASVEDVVRRARLTR